MRNPENCSIWRNMKFNEFNLNEKILRGIDEAGFVECTAVQESSLAKTLNGIDVYVQSKTGTGKTAAFLITIFNLFLNNPKYKTRKALVIVPTRELAVQVELEAEQLGKYCNFKMGSFFGGIGYDKQERLLKENLNLYVGTPGRLIDFCKSGKINLKEMEILVIDEADRMFDMGFIPDIRWMAKRMVPPAERLTMLYSATLNTKVKQLAWEYMNEPAEIEIEPETVTVDTITQELYHVTKDRKFNLLLGIMKKINPGSALIFTNTKRMAEIVSRRLNGNGIRNDYISGDLPQKKRLKIIDAIKSGSTEILVATDVAARGLHIEDLDIVINYDLPDDFQNYVHRIGRTARAGKSGKAVSLACEQYVWNLEAIEKFIGMKIPSFFPDDDLFLEDASGYRHSSGGDRRTRREPGRERGTGRGKERGRDRERPGARSERRPAREISRKPQIPEQTRKRGGKSRDDSEAPATVQPQPERAVSAPRRRERQEPRQRREQHTRPPQDRKESPEARTADQLDKGASMNERIEYYKRKYGEDFSYKAGTESEKSLKGKTKKSVLTKIRSLFKKEK